MDKKKIEIIGVAVLAAAFIYMWAGTIAKVRHAVVTPPAAVSVPAIIPNQGLFGVKQAPVVKKTQGVGWGRDPFVLRDTSPQDADTIAGLKLMGITVSDNMKAMAVINNEIVKVGSRIGRFRVLKIAAKSVIVTDGRENYTLKME